MERSVQAATTAAVVAERGPAERGAAAGPAGPHGEQVAGRARARSRWTTAAGAVPIRPLGRHPQLDGLRAAAVGAVIAFHYQLLPGGAAGVDVFFVLSGFLITSLVLDEWHRTGTVDLRAFYRRRVARLLPALAAFLLADLALRHWADPGLGLGDLLAHAARPLTFVQNWPFAGGAPKDDLVITWSLAVEEQFYAVWPLVLVALLRRRTSCRRLVGGTIAADAASLVLAQLVWWVGHAEDRAYFGTDTRLWGLLLGCVLAELRSLGLLRLPARVRRALPTAAGVALVAVAVVADRASVPSLVGGLGVVVAGAAVVIVLAVTEGTLRAGRPAGAAPADGAAAVGGAAVVGGAAATEPALTIGGVAGLGVGLVVGVVLGGRASRAVGRLSYCLYLFHDLALRTVLVVGGSHNVGPGVVPALVVTAGVCTLFHRVVEEPTRQAGARWASSPGRRWSAGRARAGVGPEPARSAGVVSGAALLPS